MYYIKKLALITTHIILIVAQFSSDKPYQLKLAGDIDLYLALVKGSVRFVDPIFYNQLPKEDKVARLEDADDSKRNYYINFCGRLLSAKSTDPGIVTSPTRSTLTRWQISPTEVGHKITRDGKCLVKMNSKDNVNGGFYANQQPCYGVYNFHFLVEKADGKLGDYCPKFKDVEKEDKIAEPVEKEKEKEAENLEAKDVPEPEKPNKAIDSPPDTIALTPDNYVALGPFPFMLKIRPERSPFDNPNEPSENRQSPTNLDPFNTGVMNFPQNQSEAGPNDGKQNGNGPGGSPSKGPGGKLPKGSRGKRPSTKHPATRCPARFLGNPNEGKSFDVPRKRPNGGAGPDDSSNAGPDAGPTTGPTGGPSTGPQGGPSTGPQGGPASGLQGSPGYDSAYDPILNPSGTPISGPTGLPGNGAPGSPGSGPPGIPTSSPGGGPGAGPAGSPGSGPAGSPGSGPAGSPNAGLGGSPGSGPPGSPTNPSSPAAPSTPASPFNSSPANATPEDFNRLKDLFANMLPSGSPHDPAKKPSPGKKPPQSRVVCMEVNR